MSYSIEKANCAFLYLIQCVKHLWHENEGKNNHFVLIEQLGIHIN